VGRLGGSDFTGILMTTSSKYYACIAFSFIEFCLDLSNESCRKIVSFCRIVYAEGDVFKVINDNITIFLGLGFIIVGYYYLIDKFSLSPYSILAFSISAFLFVIADYCEFRYTEIKGINNKSKWLYFWRYMHSIFQGLAAITIVLLPLYHPNWNDETINKINNTTLLFGLGITILLIGLKTERNRWIFIDKILRNQEEMFQLSKKVIESTQKYIENSSDNTKEMKKALDSIISRQDGT
jgi:hypothetical protein